MKYAFYPGCVARGGAPELYQSTLRVAEELGLELVEVTKAACTGAGVLQEKNRKLGDILNVRTLALAEQIGSPLLTICSTCQGVFSQVNYNVKKNPEYLEELNGHLAEEGLKYSGNTEVKHLMWAILEDIGTDKLKKHITAASPICRWLRSTDVMWSARRRHSVTISIRGASARWRTLSSWWEPRWWTLRARRPVAVCRFC